MISEVFVICAATGAGETAGRTEHVPVMPERIADWATQAARAAAASVHVHGRYQHTGHGSGEVTLYRAVVDRLCTSDVDPVLDLTDDNLYLSHRRLATNAQLAASAIGVLAA
jgi:uncharacterized protein (DUF849 family)